MYSNTMVFLVVLIAPGIVFAELNLQFPEFLEFWITLYESCGDNSNITGKIQSSFTTCLGNVPLEESQQFPWNYCSNRTGYLNCWESLSADINNTCSNKMTPGIYKATLQAYCKKDNGKQSSEKWNKVLKDLQTSGGNTEKGCPNATGEHWKDACKDLNMSMISPDLCKRHTGIAMCLKKITCDNYPMTSLLRTSYQESRAYLNCSKVL